MTAEKASEYPTRLRWLPIRVDTTDPELILALPNVAQAYELTNYDGALP